MIIITILLKIVLVLVCLLLVGVILLQRSKGSGAGVSFGGGMGEALFGAQMGDVLTKTTIILGIIFLVTTLALSRLSKPGAASGQSLMASEPPTAAVVPETPRSPATPSRDVAAELPAEATPAGTLPETATPAP